MRTALTMLAAAMTVLAAITCSGPAFDAPVQPPRAAAAISEGSWQNRWERTLAAARKEGQVVVYAAVSPEVRAVLGKAFSQKFGLGIEFVTGAAGELTLKLITERQAGLYLGDVVLAGAAPLVASMKPEALLDSMRPALILPEVLDGKLWRGGALPFADRQATAMALTSQFNVGLIRNTDMVKAGQSPSFDDLLKPGWKRKLVMLDPTVSGSGSNLVGAWVRGSWGMERTREYLKGLVRQEVAFTRDQRLHVEWVARGKYPLGIGGGAGQLTSFMRAGAPVLPVATAEGGYVTWGNGGLGLLVKPAHPAAAAVFINWLLSREGQTVFSQGFGAPSKRVDIPETGRYASPVVVPTSNLYVEDEEGVLARAQILTMAREVMAPLFR